MSVSFLLNFVWKMPVSFGFRQGETGTALLWSYRLKSPIYISELYAEIFQCEFWNWYRNFLIPSSRLMLNLLGRWTWMANWILSKCLNANFLSSMALVLFCDSFILVCKGMSDLNWTWFLLCWFNDLINLDYVLAWNRRRKNFESMME